nr:hypothetical protein [Tanacetum cinerariifolium]
MIGDDCDKGRMPTKIELTLKQSQQGVSNDVLVSIEGVKELKRNVWTNGENKEELHTTLGRNRVNTYAIGFHKDEFFIATLIVSISFDSSEESVGSSTSRVIMFGTIPIVIPADVSTVGPTVLEVTATIVASPTGASDDSSSGDSFESLPSLDLHEIDVARWRGTVASRSRVYPFMARIPTNRRRFHSSPSSSPRKRYRESPYSSSSDLPTSIVDDSPAPHRFVDLHLIRTSRDSEAYHYWRAAPLSNVYPPTTFESSSGDFSSDLSTSSSERTPHSSATHSLTPSMSVGPSQKICRSPATLIRGFSATSSSEDSSEGCMKVGSEEDIGLVVIADVDANIVAEAAAANEVRDETEVGFGGDDEAEDEAESSG